MRHFHHICMTKSIFILIWNELMFLTGTLKYTMKLIYIFTNWLTHYCSRKKLCITLKLNPVLFALLKTHTQYRYLLIIFLIYFFYYYRWPLFAKIRYYHKYTWSSIKYIANKPSAEDHTAFEQLSSFIYKIILNLE